MQNGNLTTRLSLSRCHSFFGLHSLVFIISASATPYLTRRLSCWLQYALLCARVATVFCHLTLGTVSGASAREPSSPSLRPPHRLRACSLSPPQRSTSSTESSKAACVASSRPIPGWQAATVADLYAVFSGDRVCSGGRREIVDGEAAAAFVGGTAGRVAWIAAVAREESRGLRRGQHQVTVGGCAPDCFVSVHRARLHGTCQGTAGDGRWDGHATVTDQCTETGDGRWNGRATVTDQCTETGVFRCLAFSASPFNAFSPNSRGLFYALISCDSQLISFHWSAGILSSVTTSLLLH